MPPLIINNATPSSKRHVEPGASLKGNVRVPGDKSISHRALLFGAISEGETIIEGLLPAEDPISTAKCLRLMGVKIETKTINVSKSIKNFDEKNNEIGELRSGVYSPHFGQVIGIAMMLKPYWNKSQSFKIELNGKSFDGKVCDLSFI